MAFSPSVQERTPSTAITKDGLAWVASIMTEAGWQRYRALRAEVRSKVDEPCPRCGCTLSYWLDPYQMCYRCFPRRLTEAQWQRLRALFPCTSLRLALAGGVHNV